MIGDVESAGLVKFDFLGLKTLTIIKQSVNRINSKLHDETERIDIDNISLKDEKTFEFFREEKQLEYFSLNPGYERLSKATRTK